jgi:hypothetical protein
MTTIKSYTDIDQSKKLAEILPLESADMHHSKDFDGSWFVDLAKYTSVKIPKYVGNVEEHLLPCWSLASLLEQLPYELCDDDGNSLYLQIYKDDDLYQLEYKDNSLYGDFESIEIDRYEDFVDACVAMIKRLHELNLL